MLGMADWGWGLERGRVPDSEECWSEEDAKLHVGDWFEDACGYLTF